ncbi:hypothetical protein FQA39_LY17698 [Lamprigera yunnana]|nr:hypothetical protein FQA39_LY17698 [Lamprigera yunnana]
MVTKKKSKGFPYKMCILILIFAIMGIVYHDIRSHGAWQRSRTFNYLKDYGIVEHCYVLANRIKDGLHWLHLKVDEQVPGYYEKVSEQAAPYGQLVKELLIIFCNIFHNTRETILKNYPQVFALVSVNCHVK